MLPKFIEIKTRYDSLYNRMLSEGRLPLKETSLGYWGISTAEDIFELFRMLGLEKSRRFIDLGSGDGKVTLIASLFTRSVGIEIDDELVSHSKKIRDELGLKAKFINGNYHAHDISGYDLVFINPDQSLARLEQKLFRELRGKLVVYGPHYHPRLLKKEASFIANTSPVAVFTNKALQA